MAPTARELIYNYLTGRAACMNPRTADTANSLLDDLSAEARQQADAECDAARDEIARLHTWDGLMSLLDEHYPPDVITGASGDPGPRIAALLREIDRLRQGDEGGELR